MPTFIHWRPGTTLLNGGLAFTGRHYLFFPGVDRRSTMRRTYLPTFILEGVIRWRLVEIPTWYRGWVVILLTSLSTFPHFWRDFPTISFIPTFCSIPVFRRWRGGISCIWCNGTMADGRHHKPYIWLPFIVVSIWSYSVGEDGKGTICSSHHDILTCYSDGRRDTTFICLHWRRASTTQFYYFWLRIRIPWLKEWENPHPYDRWSTRGDRRGYFDLEWPVPTMVSGIRPGVFPVILIIYSILKVGDLHFTPAIPGIRLSRLSEGYSLQILFDDGGASVTPYFSPLPIHYTFPVGYRGVPPFLTLFYLAFGDSIPTVFRPALRPFPGWPRRCDYSVATDHSLHFISCILPGGREGIHLFIGDISKEADSFLLTCRWAARLRYRLVPFDRAIQLYLYVHIPRHFLPSHSWRNSPPDWWTLQPVRLNLFHYSILAWCPLISLFVAILNRLGRRACCSVLVTWHSPYRPPPVRSVFVLSFFVTWWWRYTYRHSHHRAFSISSWAFYGPTYILATRLEGISIERVRVYNAPRHFIRPEVFFIPFGGRYSTSWLTLIPWWWWRFLHSFWLTHWWFREEHSRSDHFIQPDWRPWKRTCSVSSSFPFRYLCPVSRGGADRHRIIQFSQWKEGAVEGRWRENSTVWSCCPIHAA